MNIEALKTDGRAVSPVIAVVLMVAITVTLATVIGVFVLGAQEQIPSAQSADFAFDYKGGSTEELIVTHAGGEKLDASNVYLRGENFDESGQSWDSIPDAEVDSASRVSNGDSVRLTEVKPGYTLRVAYVGPDSSTTLQETEGPNA